MFVNQTYAQICVNVYFTFYGNIRILFLLLNGKCMGKNDEINTTKQYVTIIIISATNTRTKYINIFLVFIRNNGTF